MSTPSLVRKSHLLGTKLRALRKRNGLTLEELSARCIQRDPAAAPSVSYLSMIESGKRIPSEDMLDLIASVFQRDREWFLDETGIEPSFADERKGGATKTPFEPAFLFSKDRQFAHLLSRSHQEMSRSDFPDLEGAAERIGERRCPLGVEVLLALCRRHGLEVRWFDRKPVLTRDQDRELRSMLRSFYEPPGTLYLNRALQAQPARLKFDLAAHIAHKVLHGGDGLKSAHATGGEMGGAPESSPGDAGLDAQDILHAWRDFECSFFAGALLCPKVPFRRFLAREQYRVAEVGRRLELTPAVVMRRMTKVSPYPHWHFFDAYPPGYLRAVYRGNGIPLPWGNMARVTDPCPHWAVFRMIDDDSKQQGSQLSVLRDGDRWLLYCCHSIRTQDMAGNPHVLSVGVDLVPALQSNGADAGAVVATIAEDCQRRGGEARIARGAMQAISGIARVLDIAWIEEALAFPARIICPRSTRCPRGERCAGPRPSRARDLLDVRREITDQAKPGA